MVSSRNCVAAGWNRMAVWNMMAARDNERELSDERELGDGRASENLCSFLFR